MTYIEKEPLLQIAKELQGNLFGAPLIVKAIESAPVVGGIGMAEFCKECFKEQIVVPSDGITDDMLVMSDWNDLCEGCGELKSVVLEVKWDAESFNSKD